MPYLGPIIRHHSFRCLFCHRRLFSYTAGCYADTIPNYYEALGVSPSANAIEIKQAFYALSKRHHPDRNPGNPDSAKKFVQISEAYHVLSSPSSRRNYDPQCIQHHGYGNRPTPRGSHSSHSHTGPAGGRTASGLSRRRAQFRGPPPSFYRSGGWGSYSAKRARAQYASSSDGAADLCEDRPAERRGGTATGTAYWAKGPYTINRSGTSPGGHASGGFSPGQATPAYEVDPTIPHWDRAGHFRTQENIRRRHSEMASRAKAREEELRLQEHRLTSGDSMGGMFVRFSAVLGCIVFVMAASGWVFRRKDSGWRARDNG